MIRRTLTVMLLVAALAGCQGREGQDTSTDPSNQNLPTAIPGVQSTETAPDTQQMRDPIITDTLTPAATP
jgi:hypothetical protein